MNIRLIVADNWPTNDVFEDDNQITQYVDDNCNNTDKLINNGLKIEDFSTPDNFDRQLILDICTGKQFHICWGNRVDFYTDYYQSWIFVFDGEKYGPFNYVPNELEKVVK
jgi:hypothetical protein